MINCHKILGGKEVKKYQYLIFDLDNTIFDFWGAEDYALSRISQEDGLEFTPEVLEVYRTMNKELWEQYEQGEISQTYLNEERFVRWFAYYGIQVDGSICEKKFRHYLAEANTMMPDALDIIHELKKDFVIVAATNGIEETQLLRLKTAGLENFFEKLFISEVVGYRKPSKEFFEAVVEQTEGMTIENALMIGDSFKADIYGASRIGMDTCWYMETPERPTEPEELLSVEPTYQIGHLSELYKIVF